MRTPLTSLGRYRALAGHALRALRCDLVLLVLHHLQELPIDCWACDQPRPARRAFWFRCHTQEMQDVVPQACPSQIRYILGKLHQTYAAIWRAARWPEGKS